MPEQNDTDVPASQLFTEERLFLLKELQEQLDELLAERLIPQEKGVPFINFQNDPPQVVAIKKVINSIYHIEEALKHWESVNKSPLGYVKGAPALFQALYQVNQTVSALDDATPEVRAVIIQNYYVLEPLYSKVYELIDKSGWVTKFTKLDATEKASKVIGEGISLLGSDAEKWDNANPLILTFDKISKLMQSMAAMQDKATTEQDKKERIETIRSILDDLDENAFISQLLIADFEDAKAVQDLLAWFKDIQEDGFDFTKKSIENYISWTNNYLPKLVLLADQLERQNYLKPGLLSKHLCSNANNLAQEMNKLLDLGDTFHIVQRVVTTDFLQPLREQQINSDQIKSVQAIRAIEEQQKAAAHFYKIMRAYKGKSFPEIIESDRVLLRQAYPKVQITLAHANLEIENALTKVLNTTGPEKIESKSQSWGQKALGTIGYVASFVSDYEVNKCLATEAFFDKTLITKIDSEKFKITIAEKSRQNLQLSKAGLVSTEEQTLQGEKTSLETKVTDRINQIKKELKGTVQEKEKEPEQFVPLKASDLSNLRGALTYIQEMKLSVKIKESREALAILVKRHIAKEQDMSLNTQHVVLAKDSKVYEQIEDVEHKLVALEKQLAYFESIELKWGLTIRVSTYIEVASAAKDLRDSLLNLAPDSQKILAPILSQLTAFGSSLSNQDYANLDLSAVDKLKSTAVKLPTENHKKQEGRQTKPVMDVTKSGKEPTKAKTSKGSTVQIKQPISVDYVAEIAKARVSLLSKCKSTLTLPLSISLEPQEKGAPFINIDDDPPQVAAIKKMINSMYYAEIAIKIWQEIDTSTTFGKVAAAHQGVVVLSQLYKSLSFFADASPEVQSLIRENQDLIKPVISGAKAMIQDNQFSGIELTNAIGSVLGQIVSSVQSSPEGQTQTASLVNLLSELPSIMSNMSTLVGEDEEVSVKKLKLNKEKIEAISRVLELLFEENSSFLNIFKGPQAIIGLIDLNKKFQKEATNLQESTIRYYQQWLDNRYPHLLVMLDEVETRYYLKPGTLSGPIVLEIDKINDKLNEVIESKPPSSKLARINLSTDLASIRKMSLDIKKAGLWNDVFKYEEQQRAAHIFFSTLGKYKDKKFLDISPEDRIILRQNFVLIQFALSNINIDLANECVIALNQLETVTPDKWTGVKVSIPQILKHGASVRNYILQRYKAAQLKLKVNDYAVEHIRFTAGEDVAFDSEEQSVDALQKSYLEIQAKKTVVGPGELQPIIISSLTNIRGNLAYIQELQISSLVAEMRVQCTQLTKKRFSKYIQNYLDKPKDQPLYNIREIDPLMVRQIKEIENGLYHLETAFIHFEKISKSDKLVVQARALIEIQNEASHLKDIIDNLTPELKEHYGPLALKMLEFSQKIRAIDYNKEDLQDLAAVLQSAKDELLRRKIPRKTQAERAFFDSSSNGTQFNPNEPATTKAVRLGIKYLHLASPKLEEARRYLRSRYPNSFETQRPVVRNYTRQQLSDEQLMRSEISRLKVAFQEHFGFNFTTIGLIIDVIHQVQRVGSQATEALGMVNQLVTNDYVKIKEHVYKDLIARLSQEEDYLCLQPGTLIAPAMSIINQLFLSVALELDMPFDNKLSLLDEKEFLNLLIAQTLQDVRELKTALEKNPGNSEIVFKIGIKEEKLLYLREQISLVADKDLNQTKSALLDIQFEVYLRDLLKETTIKKPIVNEFEQIVRKHYLDNKKDFLGASDCANTLYESMNNFERENISDYLMAYEAYRMLKVFSSKLPPRHQDLSDYIDIINKELLNDKISIKERSLKVQLLPRDKVFLQKLSAADDGTSLVVKLIQFIQRVASSIIESALTGKSISTIYNQKAMKQLKGNIESTINSEDMVMTGSGKEASLKFDRDDTVTKKEEINLQDESEQIEDNEEVVELDEEQVENKSMQFK